MKNLILIIIFVSCVATSFVIGANVGATKMYVHRQSLQANDAMYEIQYKMIDFDSLESLEDHIKQKNFQNINDAAMEYGRYLDSWKSDVPVLIQMNAATLSFYKKSLNFYLDNKYKQPEESPEDAATRIINEMRADGKLMEELADDTYQSLVYSITERQSSFDRAVLEVSK